MSDIKELIASKLRPVANAVRSQKGTTDLIPVDDLEAEILSIPKAKDLEDFIKTIFKGGKVETLTVPDFITEANSEYLLNGITVDTLIISKNLKNIPKNFCYKTVVKKALYLPKIESVQSGFFTGFGGAGSISKYFDGTLIDWINIECFDTTLQSLFFEPNVVNDSHNSYFKNENGSYYNVSEIDEFVIPEDVLILKEYALANFPKAVILNNVESLQSYTLQNVQAGTLSIIGGGYINTLYLKNIIFPSKITLCSKSACSGICANDLIVESQAVANADSVFSRATVNNVILGNDISEISPNFMSSGNVCNNIVFNDGLVTINNRAFVECNGLEKQITVPESVEFIGTYAFYTKFRATFIFKSTIPCTLETNAFKTSTLNKIYVPKGYASTYKTATNWSTYADYIFAPNTVTVLIPDTLLNNENYKYSIDGDELQQFSGSSLTLADIATFKIKNSGDVTINVGTTDGGNEIGSVGTGAELLYATESDTTIYLTIQA